MIVSDVSIFEPRRIFTGKVEWGSHPPHSILGYFEVILAKEGNSWIYN